MRTPKFKQPPSCQPKATIPLDPRYRARGHESSPANYVQNWSAPIYAKPPWLMRETLARYTRFTQTRWANTQIDAWLTHTDYKLHGFDLLLHFWTESPLFIKRRLQVDAEEEVELELLLFAVGWWSGVMLLYCVFVWAKQSNCRLLHSTKFLVDP